MVSSMSLDLQGKLQVLQTQSRIDRDCQGPWLRGRADMEDDTIGNNGFFVLLEFL